MIIYEYYLNKQYLSTNMFPQLQSEDGVYRFDVDFQGREFQERHIVYDISNPTEYVDVSTNPFESEQVPVLYEIIIFMNKPSCMTTIKCVGDKWLCDKWYERSEPITFSDRIFHDYVFKRMKSVRGIVESTYLEDIRGMNDIVVM